VLNQGDWCLLQVGDYKHYCRVGAQERRLVSLAGWCLHDFIKKSFVVFSHLGFHVKSLCIVDFMVVYIFIINFLWLVK